MSIPVAIGLVGLIVYVVVPAKGRTRMILALGPAYFGFVSATGAGAASRLGGFAWGLVDPTVAWLLILAFGGLCLLPLRMTRTGGVRLFVAAGLVLIGSVVGYAAGAVFGNFIPGSYE